MNTPRRIFFSVPYDTNAEKYLLTPQILGEQYASYVTQIIDGLSEKEAYEAMLDVFTRLCGGNLAEAEYKTS